MSPGSNNTGIPWQCQTGNCTFPQPYTSLAVCSSCSNTVYDVKTDCSVTKSQGLYVGGETICKSVLEPDPDSTTRIVLQQTSSYYPMALGLKSLMRTYSNFSSANNNMLRSIANFGILTFTTSSCSNSWANDGVRSPNHDCLNVGDLNPPTEDGSSWKPYNIVSTNCQLSYCLKSYTANVTQGRIIEEVVETKMPSGTTGPGAVEAHIPSNVNQMLALISDPCYINGSTRSLDQISNGKLQDDRYIDVTLGDSSDSTGVSIRVLRECVRMVSYDSAAALGIYYQDLLRDGTGMRTSMPSIIGEGPNAAMGLIQFTPSMIEPLFGQGTTSLRKINESMAAVADSMTNHLRRNALGGSKALGLVSDTVTCVQVNYAWLAFPTFLVVLCGVFLLCTILASPRDEQPWKSSIYPLVFQALRQEDGTAVGARDSLHEMEEEAKTLRLTLLRNTRRDAAEEDAR